MNKGYILNPLSIADPFSSISSVLVRGGQSDESLCYQAPIHKWIASDCVLLRFHARSLMLDRVLLIGDLLVTIELGAEMGFSGRLSPAGKSYGSIEGEGMTLLALTILQEVTVERCLDGLCPET